MSLVEKVRTFVRFLKTGDKEYGEGILQLLEASPIRESNEHGFMLWQSGLFVYVMQEHQRKLNELDTRMSKLLAATKPASSSSE
jgi:hypothetical protein